MGLLNKYKVVEYCPNCRQDILLDVPRIGHYEKRGICFKCGARFKAVAHWGKTAVTRSGGFQGMSLDGAHYLPDLSKPEGGAIGHMEHCVGNVKYWEEHHGDNWLQAHDEFMSKHEEWLTNHRDG